MLVLNPGDIPTWNDSLLSHPDHSFFHTSNWADTLHRAYGYQPLYFMTEEQGDRPAVLPVMEVNSWITGKRGVSLPFTDYCEPLASTRDQFQALFSFATDYGKKRGWKYMELRGGQDYLEEQEPSILFWGHTISLADGAEATFSNFHDSTKRNIKKAEKEGVKIEITDSLNAIEEFYRLNCLTRRDHGLPPQPYHFFKQIYDRIISRHAGFVSLATFKNIAVAANVFFIFGEKVVYKYGASDRAYQHLRANNLAMWEAIKRCCEDGYKSLCLGRTEIENNGLRQFKLGWGAKEHVIKYYKYDFQKGGFIKESRKISAFQHKFFNKLPIPMLKVIGTLLYRHMG
jgi:hypothetical protein